MTLIQILGTGCPKCKKLEENTRQATAQMGLECEVLKVSDITAIMNMGVMMTPALAIDGRVILTGKVPSAMELQDIIRENIQE